MMIGQDINKQIDILTDGSEKNTFYVLVLIIQDTLQKL